MGKGSSALQGAGTGAAAGSIVPGIGTAIGAGVGGLAGYLLGSDDPQRQALTAPVNPVTGQQLTDAAGNTTSGLNQQQAFLNALQGQNGIANQSSVFNQLQGVANGTGANPAQAMLAQATGQNVANQAALMASQRGTAANAGLLARQAAQQGGALQQNSAGQAATLQANQSLGALGQLGGIAGQQVGQQANALNAYNQFSQNNQGQLLGAAGNYNNALNGYNNALNGQVGNDLNQQGINNKVTGSVLQGAGAAVGALAGSGGGNPSTAPMSTATPTALPASRMADTTFAAQGGIIEGPRSAVGRHLKGMSTQKFAHGGKVQALVSPGEVYVSPDKVKSKDPIKAGEKIPGKPKVRGNDLRNDTVPKKLAPGGIVIPNSVMQSKDPHGEAIKFVHAVLAKKGLRK